MTLEKDNDGNGINMKMNEKTDKTITTIMIIVCGVTKDVKDNFTIISNGGRDRYTLT